MTDLFERVLLPVAHREDAAATCRAVDGYDLGRVVAVHVVEKAGGAPDKASVEQRELEAEAAFDEIAACLPEAETEIRYGTSVTDTIFQAADDHDATSVVITPRGGNRFVQLLTGDVALHLVTESERPVVVLPDPAADGADGADKADGADGADERNDDDADERNDDTDSPDDRADGGDPGPGGEPGAQNQGE